MITSLIEKNRLSTWFSALQHNICSILESLEREFSHDKRGDEGGQAARFKQEQWERFDGSQPDGKGGGGNMASLRGNVFEKGGVNVSTVFGEFLPEFAAEIPGASENPSFWASGLSLVIHPLNPYVPAVHMNTRHICTGKSWFGGGIDLTPTFEFEQDNLDFHNAMKAACSSLVEEACSQSHGESYYEKYKKWCDDYFYLPHRQEPRGIGGIFYDYHNTGCFERDFAFTQAVGQAFLDIYPQLVRRHMHRPWGKAEKNKQLIKRGRYAEFNLLYDRGTKFGLKTQGNVEAILMSLPPLAAWG